MAGVVIGITETDDFFAKIVRFLVYAVEEVICLVQGVKEHSISPKFRSQPLSLFFSNHGKH